jgi:catechol 2,3-dioxygenase-like lactoylglutathione lyase family enzyme
VAIIGIETLVYCVDDIPLCTQYFEDFGLRLHDRSSDKTTFVLPDNSKVIIQSLADDPIPGSQVVAKGVHEVIWGLDDEASLERLVVGLERDRTVRRDDDGTAHFLTDDGIAMALRVWRDKRAVRTTTDPVNSPGNINRMNVHRRWIDRARPQYIQHAVFMTPDVEASFAWMRDRLDFRLSDHQRQLGVFARADGTTDHHNIYFLNANAPLPGADGQIRFHHANFLVTDLDEMMIGKNYMERRGWSRSHWGIGRHRVASALFLYLPAPTGGEAEYGADSDAIDDSWLPRTWEPLFGFGHWMHDMPAFWSQGADWDVGFVQGLAPSKGSVKPYEASALGSVAEGTHPDDRKTEASIVLPRELRPEQDAA